MDINALLKQTTTAPTDGGASSERWVRGARRKHSRAATMDGPSERPLQGPRGEVQGIDLDAIQRDLAAQREANSRTASSSTAAPSNSVFAAERMAHLVLEYVLVRELGGRHNAHKRPDDSDAPAKVQPSQLMAERATLRKVARLTISHVIHLGAATEQSTTWTEPVPETVLAYRKALRVCDVRRDLVGGLTSAVTSHNRAYLHRLVAAGLKGEAWRRPDVEGQAATMPSASASTSLVPAEPTAVNIFAEADGAFSLTGFLNGSTSGEED